MYISGVTMAERPGQFARAPKFLCNKMHLKCFKHYLMGLNI